MAKRQHGVITRALLLELGYSSRAIAHRLESGRLHRVWRGVYSVGLGELSQHARFIAAVLSSGPAAVLSHGSAAGLWELLPAPRIMHVSVLGDSRAAMAASSSTVAGSPPPT